LSFSSVKYFSERPLHYFARISIYPHNISVVQVSTAGAYFKHTLNTKVTILETNTPVLSSRNKLVLIPTWNTIMLHIASTRQKFQIDISNTFTEYKNILTELFTIQITCANSFLFSAVFSFLSPAGSTKLQKDSHSSLHSLFKV
jgi:hypothetical protein